MKLPSISNESVIIFVAGLATFTFRFFVPIWANRYYSVGLPILFLALYLLLSTSGRGSRRYSPVFYSFFMASFALVIDLTAVQASYQYLGITSETLQGSFFRQSLSATVTIAVLILLARIQGRSFSSIYLTKGRNLKYGLALGVTAFLVISLSSVGASALFPWANMNVGKVLALLPWAIPLAFLSGFSKELLFRGIFMREYEILLRARAANILQALIFALAGVSPEITIHSAVFAILTFALGYILGEIVLRTNSLLGSSIFHAGVQLPVVLSLLTRI